MCSWCWGFKPTLETFKRKLPSDIKIQYLLGGLAEDSSALMPLSMQRDIKNTWRKIQSSIPNTQFNYDFWTDNKPRRSTYAACRAVIAARTMQSDLHFKMIDKIQTAYYLDALNPSDTDILIGLAKALKLDSTQFKRLLLSDDTQQALMQEIEYSRELGVYSYPSLILMNGENIKTINIHYCDYQAILNEITHHLNDHHHNIKQRFE